MVPWAAAPRAHPQGHLSRPPSGPPLLNGVHNHELEPKLEGHLLAGRLKEEEKKRVVDMIKSLALPRNILTNLKEKNKESVTNIKQVYNARARCRKSKGRM